MARISNAEFGQMLEQERGTVGYPFEVAFSEDEPTCAACGSVRWVSRDDFLVFYKKALQSVVEEPEQVRPILRMILRREKAALEQIENG